MGRIRAEAHTPLFHGLGILVRRRPVSHQQFHLYGVAALTGPAVGEPVPAGLPELLEILIRLFPIHIPPEPSHLPPVGAQADMVILDPAVELVHHALPLCHGDLGQEGDGVDAHLHDHQMHLRRAVWGALPERLGTLVKKGAELRRHRDGLGRIVPEGGLVAVVAPEHQPPVGISGLVRLPDGVQISVHLGLSPGEPLDRRLQLLAAKLRLSHTVLLVYSAEATRRPPSRIIFTTSSRSSSWKKPMALSGRSFPSSPRSKRSFR